MPLRRLARDTIVRRGQRPLHRHSPPAGCPARAKCAGLVAALIGMVGERAVLHHLLAMKGARRAGNALTKQPRIFVYPDSHDVLP